MNVVKGRSNKLSNSTAFSFLGITRTARSWGTKTTRSLQAHPYCSKMSPSNANTSFMRCMTSKAMASEHNQIAGVVVTKRRSTRPATSVVMLPEASLWKGRAKTSAGKSCNMTSVKNRQEWSTRPVSATLLRELSTASRTCRSVDTSGCHGNTSKIASMVTPWVPFQGCRVEYLSRFFTDSSVVVSAPTGSGKTAIFELAIVQLLKKMDDMNYSQNFKIVYKYLSRFFTDSSVVVSAPTGSGKTAIFELAIVQLLKKMDDMNYSQNFKIVYKYLSRFFTDSSVVVSAPTGSGKTAIFELAIVQLLKKMDDMNYSQNFKIVYMAPVKALCAERFRDWDAKFSRYGLTCKEVTGDSYETDLLEISHCRLILTTPEKWDSLTRRWKDNRGLVQVVKLFLIDEVHLLNEERRGATLEAVVSRMKTVQKTLRLDRHMPSHTFLPLRFIAVSATIPNVEDVAQWLGCDDSPAKHYKISDELRPVKLNKVVIGYPCTTASPFQFDIGLSYKLKPILIKYSDLKPTLIFCSTRKGVQQTSSVLAQQLTFEFNQEQREKLTLAANLIQENKLKALLKGGIGYHHAGMDLADRSTTEQVFHSGYLPVLVTTSTLAMGVNLPAHLVIIKSTQQYVYGGYQEYSETQVLQMIGRAGRPQFDTSATAVIMTKENTKHRYERLVDGKELVESSLHRHLTEHLNAEVVLQTITEHAVAMDWIRSTFLYVRALSNPRHYGFPANLDKRGIEYKLEQMCLIELNELSKAKLITIDLINISPTETGCLMARYYLAFQSMKIFAKVCGSEKLQELLSLLSECHEFADVQLRVSEKKTLNALNNTKDQECIRFPLPGKIKTRDMKVNCLIQAVFGGLQIYDTSLNQDATKIVRAGERVSKCLVQFLNQQPQYQSLLSAIILAKCFYRKLWENTPYVSRQLERIGPALSSLLAKNGKTSFRAIVESNPRDLERILNRPPPMGNRIQEAVRGLPYFSLDLEGSDNQFAKVTVTVKLLNPELVLRINMSSNEHCFTLLVGDSENRLLLNKRIRTVDMVLSPILVLSVNQNNAKEVYANLLSEKWIGLDVSATIKVSNLKHLQQNLKVSIDKIQKSKQSKLILTNTEEKPKKLKKPTLIDQIQEKHAGMYNLPGMKLKTNPPQNSTHVDLNKFQYRPLRKEQLVPLEASEKTALTDELTIQGHIRRGREKRKSKYGRDPREPSDIALYFNFPLRLANRGKVMS
uniref:DNA 3'-5' helicase n=1 Tax=Timema californicum TaxID=61474 RepID=A0A7R9J0W4_TIMCA|nr:unnamed protein product [Timema californicum]